MGRFDGDNTVPFSRTVIPVPDEKPAKKSVRSSEPEGPVRKNLSAFDLERIALNRIKKISRVKFIEKMKILFSLIELSKDMKEQSENSIYL